MTPKKYLDQFEVFKTGQWEGETLEDVASEVPEYLENLLGMGELCHTEEEAIREALENCRID